MAVTARSAPHSAATAPTVASAVMTSATATASAPPAARSGAGWLWYLDAPVLEVRGAWVWLAAATSLPGGGEFMSPASLVGSGARAAAAGRGPPPETAGVLASAADTGAEVLTITPSDRRGRVSDAPLPHKAPAAPRS